MNISTYQEELDEKESQSKEEYIYEKKKKENIIPGVHQSNEMDWRRGQPPAHEHFYATSRSAKG